MSQSDYKSDQRLTRRQRLSRTVDLPVSVYISVSLIVFCKLSLKKQVLVKLLASSLGGHVYLLYRQCLKCNIQNMFVHKRVT